jgi:hypothetical protein
LRQESVISVEMQGQAGPGAKFRAGLERRKLRWLDPS